VTRTFKYRLYPTAGQEAHLRRRHRVKGWTLQHDGTSSRGRLLLSEVGPVKIRLHRPLPPGVRSLDLRCQCGEWYACFECRIAPQEEPAPEEAVGVDVGEAVIATDSEGHKHFPSKAFKSGQQTFSRARDVAQRRQEGSRRRGRAEKARERAARRVLRSRRDAAHKIARRLVGRFDLITVGKMHCPPEPALLLHRKKAAKATWGLLFRLLEEKAGAAGRQVLAIPEQGTSQECSGCGVIGKKKPLSERRHVCAECGLSLDRDVNAAVNLRQRGLALAIAAAERGWAEVGALAGALMAEALRGPHQIHRLMDGPEEPNAHRARRVEPPGLSHPLLQTS
jgi:putative transposase